MLSLRVPELPAGDWIYEVKFDGYRALAFKTGSEVHLMSRNRMLFNDNYPVLIDAFKTLKADFAIDGEIAAPDKMADLLSKSFNLTEFARGPRSSTTSLICSPWTGMRILFTKSLALGVHFDTALPRRAR